MLIHICPMPVHVSELTCSTHTSVMLRALLVAHAESHAMLLSLCDCVSYKLVIHRLDRNHAQRMDSCTDVCKLVQQHTEDTVRWTGRNVSPVICSCSLP